MTKQDGRFTVNTSKDNYSCDYVVIATGYYDHPNYMNVKGEDLPHVYHYFKEGHPYFDKDVTVIGGKNSSVDAALELVKCGSRVTVLYRGTEYSSSIKPWILPEFEALVRNGTIRMEFGAQVKEITEEDVIFTNQQNQTDRVKSDYVFAMTGYHPDHSFLEKWVSRLIQNQAVQHLMNRRWKRMLKVFSLRESLLLEIMPMKFSLKMEDFMADSLQKKSTKESTDKKELNPSKGFGSFYINWDYIERYFRKMGPSHIKKGKSWYDNEG